VGDKRFTICELFAANFALEGLKKKLFLFNFYRNLILSFFFRILRHANYRMGVMGDIHTHSVIFTRIL
jgi:hypothetical protein